MMSSHKNEVGPGDDFTEPKGAFPYRAPTPEIQNAYAHLYSPNLRMPARPLKRGMDVIVAGVLSVAALPILGLLKLGYLIEGFLVPENRGPLLLWYYGVSGGKAFRKYKVRVVKMSAIDSQLAAAGDWRAFATEWAPQSRTVLGSFVKKFYLDELPQFFAILKGEMSLVGPRPLCTMHYERDLAQGNVTRKLVRGGLLGLGHIRKGTSEMGNPVFEFEYANAYLQRTHAGLLSLDLWILYRGALLVCRGGGH